MRKTFYCSLGVLKSFLGLLLPAPDLGANHALLQLQTLPQLQLWLMLQGTKSLLQFFGSNFFAEYAANKFFNFVPTKSGRQGNLLRFLRKVKIKWTGQSAQVFYKSNFSDRQGNLLSYFTLTSLGVGGCSTAALNSDLDNVVASSGAAKMCFLLS